MKLCPMRDWETKCSDLYCGMWFACLGWESEWMLPMLIAVERSEIQFNLSRPQHLPLYIYNALLSTQGFCSSHREAGLGGRVLAAELMLPSMGQIWSLGAVAAAGFRAPSCPSHGTFWEVVSLLPRELTMSPRLSYQVWRLHLGWPSQHRFNVSHLISCWGAWQRKQNPALCCGK